MRRSPPGRALASLPWRPARATEAHDHMGRTQASWTQWPARAAWFRLRERRGGTHRHGNRVSMSCARCRQSKTLFPEATSCTKTLDPPSSDTTVRLVLRLGCGAPVGRERCGTVEDPWNTTEKRNLHTDYLGRAVAAAGQRTWQRGLSAGRSRSRNHRVCLIKYKHDIPYTKAERASDRPKKNDGVAPSPSRKTRRSNEPPQRQGRATPLHTQARRRRAPVDATGRRRGTRAL